MSGFNAAHSKALDEAARRRYNQQYRGMNAYDRHKKMVHELVNYYGGSIPGSSSVNNASGPAGPLPETFKSDLDVLKEGHRFIRTEKDDAEMSWEVRLAKRYYQRLYKEYAIADLSRYKEGKLGLRWRTQKEVLHGKGQFVCGAKGCEERRGLASFEVPFGYVEALERKQALVKVRLCPEHAYQLNHKSHQEREQRKQQEDHASTDDDSDENADKRSSRKKKKHKKQTSDDDRKRKSKKRRKEKTRDVADSSHDDDDDDDTSSDSEDEQKREEGGKKKRSQRKDDDQQGGFEEFFEGLFE